MGKFDLSICIPTYNRATSVAKLVSKLLQYDSPRLQVVVLDNGSTDNTLQVLRSVSDSRLCVYSNGTNKGVLYNVLNVVNHADGAFAVLLLDKDDVHPWLLGEFSRFLQMHPGLGCGYCEYGPAAAVEADIYPKGFKSLRKIGYIGHHPSGYFFNVGLLKSLDFTRRFSDFDFVGHFAFDIIFAELALLGDGAIYRRPLFSPEVPEQAAKYKSLGTNPSREDAFFSPRGRLKAAVNFSRHIYTLAITMQEKCVLIVDRFMQGLQAATLGFRSIMKNRHLCAHYHLETRRVGFFETVRTSIWFYRDFTKDVVRIGSGTHFVSPTAFKMQLLRSIAEKLTKKFFLSPK